MIGVMRGGAVGDFVVTLPAIDALRRAHPGAPLRLIANPQFAALALPDYVVDHGSASLASLYASVGTVTREAADAVAGLDLLVAYAVDTDGTLSTRLCDLVDGLLVIHDPRPLEGFSGHITDHLLAPLDRLKLPVHDPCPRIHLSTEDTAWADERWSSIGRPKGCVVIHPGSGGRRKCWPVERYISLARGLSRSDVPSVVVHGPAERDLVPALESGLPSDCVLMPSPEVPRLAALLARAALFIGNDAGPGHIAAAVGAPALSLFGPTDPRVWAPRSNEAEYIEAPGGDLADLAVDTVMDHAIAMLALLEPAPDG